MPYVDMTNFNPFGSSAASIQQRNYRQSLVVYPTANFVVGGLAAAVSPGAWEDGYPNALAPFDFFVWSDISSNFKELSGGFYGTRTKSRLRVFIIDKMGESPSAIDVTAQAVAWPTSDQNTTNAIFDPSEFTIESVSHSAGNAITFDDMADCELEPLMFSGGLPLAYGHTVGPKVFFGTMDEVV